MPKFTIETQYMLPVFRHQTIEADTLEEACQIAVEDDDWEHAEESYDGSGDVHVSGAWEGDRAYGDNPVTIPDEFLSETEKIQGDLIEALQMLADLCGEKGLYPISVEQALAAIAKAKDR
jgi:hypothetical protein